jgi:hypothetical protein
MFSLSNEHVGSDEGQGRGDRRPDRREGFLHGAKDPYDPAEGPVATIDHVDASRGRELRAHEDGSIMGDVLHYAQPLGAPSHLGREDAIRCI